MFDPFKNLSVNLRATGPAAVIIVWIIAVTWIAIFGQGELASRGLTILTVAGGMILFVLAAKA